MKITPNVAHHESKPITTTNFIISSNLGISSITGENLDCCTYSKLQLAVREYQNYQNLWSLVLFAVWLAGS